MMAPETFAASQTRDARLRMVWPRATLFRRARQPRFGREGLCDGRSPDSAVWEAIVERSWPTVGLASLRCAPFRTPKRSCHAAHTLVGVRHGSSLMEISCPRTARPTVASRTGEHLTTRSGL